MARLGRPGGLSEAGKKELLERWKAGESISDISRALKKPPGSIHGMLKAQGGIAPPHGRSSRFVMLVRLGGKDTESVVSALIKQSQRLPGELYRSLTWDRGKELADHQRLTLATEVEVYFCDPQSPWQRGSNENTNRLLRQYLPRGTDLSLHSQAKLGAIARQLHERPRKTLLYQTPAERFAECVAASVELTAQSGRSSNQRCQQCVTADFDDVSRALHTLLPRSDQYRRIDTPSTLGSELCQKTSPRGQGAHTVLVRQQVRDRLTLMSRSVSFGRGISVAA